MSELVLLIILIAVVLFIWVNIEPVDERSCKTPETKTEAFTLDDPYNPYDNIYYPDSPYPYAYSNCMDTAFGTIQCFPYLYRPYTTMWYEPISRYFLY